MAIHSSLQEPGDPPPGKVIDGEDIMGDLSILKTVVRAAPAENTAVPQWGHKVKVHYVGTLTLDGTKFDSSRDRGEPFEFTVGSGVIQGWSEAVPTMRVGEVAKFTICSEKAYGPSGSPPKIPADASLDFEIELLSFSDREDVCHDGSLLKKPLKPSPHDDWKTPNWRCDVDLLVERDGQDVACHWPADDAPPPLGLPAKVRDGIHEMKKGERASFLVPEAGDDEYVVEVVAWVENEECVDDDPGAAVKRVERPHEKHENDWKTPNDLDGVVVRGRAWAAGAPDGPCVDYGDVDGDADAAWCVDEATTTTSGLPICDGIEAVVKCMKRGEVATAKIRADAGFTEGPLAGKALECRLQLVSVAEQAPAWELKGMAKIDAVNEKRMLGNAHVARQDMARAVRRYTNAIELGASDYDLEDEEQRAMLKSAVNACKLNRGMCELRRKRFAEAEKDCKDVLAADPGNMKALFRLGKAQLATEKWDEAKANFRKMLEQDETHPEARRGLADILRREKAQRAKDKSLYAGKKLFEGHDARSEAKPKGRSYAGPAQPAPPSVNEPALTEPPPAPEALPNDPEPPAFAAPPPQ